MTHDQLRELALDAQRHPMLTAHVLALADGVLQLLAEAQGQTEPGLSPREQDGAIQEAARRIKQGFRDSTEYDEADVREELHRLIQRLS